MAACRGVYINSNDYDDDQSIEKEMMFSDVECQRYSYLSRKYSGDCESNSMVYNYNVDQQNGTVKFLEFLTYRFIIEIGANSSCKNSSGRSDNNTNIQNTTALFSKDRLFYSFMADTLNMTSACTSSNDTVMFDLDTNAAMFSYDNSDNYYAYVKYRSAGNKCVHNTSAIDSETELPYDECLFYRSMKVFVLTVVVQDISLCVKAVICTTT